MDVMGRLRRRPQRKAPVGAVSRYRRVLFNRQVGVSFIKEDIFSNMVRLRKPLADISELEGNPLMNISFFGIFMDLNIWLRECLFDVFANEWR